MRNIYFIGIIGENTSTEIYTNNIKKALKDLGKYNIVDLTKNPNKISWSEMIKERLFFSFRYKFNKEDVIIETNNLNLFPYFIFHKNYFFTIHDLGFYDEWWFKDLNLGFFIRLYYKFHKFFMGKIILKYLCKNIIAVSNATKEEIIKKYGKKLENKIVVILNGIDLETFKPYVLKRDLEKAF